MVRQIDILPFSPDWPRQFGIEMVKIRPVLVSNLISAHHIGSTAVPGLAAKPTIDILLVVHSLNILEETNAALQALGYQAKGENGIAGRRYYQKLAGERHLVHLHAYKTDNPEITRLLNFRDYLIAHPDTAQAYLALKQSLAVRFREAPKDYSVGKESFICEVDTRAASWRADMHQAQGD